MPGKGQVFEIGLCLSGGATRGAYTAGAMDFFLEALQELETAKRDGASGVPPWDVKVNNMTSTSAGSIVSFITAASLCAEHKPLPAKFDYKRAAPENNLLYQGWVTDFDGDMFATDDLQGENPIVRSLLNANYMEKLGRKILETRDASLAGKPRPPVPQWAKGTRFQVTCANYRGVPYSFKIGESLNPKHKMFRMTRHRDHVAFSTKGDASDKTAFSLDIGATGLTPAWATFLTSTASSASVPAVFPSQLLERPGIHYAKRLAAEPDWPNGVSPEAYPFLAVDGGLFNNEPLDLCRKAMGNLDKDATKTTGALILIDCHVNADPLIDLEDEVKHNSLFENLGKMFSTLWNESSFKEPEVTGILNKDNLSEFIVSPTLGCAEDMNHGALATSYLGGFAGILHGKIRHHDYLLGRRNAQSFLRKHFAVDLEKASSNPIFAGIEKYAAENYPNQKRIPIIPLKGTAVKECERPEWPKFSKKEVSQVDRWMDTLVLSRLRAVLDASVESFFPSSGWFNPLRFVSTRTVRFILHRALDQVMDKGKKQVEDVLALFPENGNPKK